MLQLMKTKDIVYITLLAAIFAAGCSRNTATKYAAPVFPEEYEVEWEIISDELMYLPWTLDMSGDYLLVNGDKQDSPATLFIYDKRSGKQLFAGLNYGRGPRETLRSRRNLVVKGDVVYQYDPVLGKRLSYNVDSLVHYGPTAIHDDSWDYPVWTKFMYESGDYVLNIRNESPVAKFKTDLPRIYLQDKEGRIVSEDNNSSIEDPGERFLLYMNIYVSVSPDGGHFAIGISGGSILETFAIGEGEIERTGTGNFTKPEIVVNPGLSGYSLKPEGLVGFEDVYAMNDCVVTSYDGISRWSDPKENRNHKIAVFNWDCTPRMLYHTQYPIMAVCAEPGCRIFYGIISDSDGRYFLARATL